MKLKILKTESEYKQAVKKLERLGDFLDSEKDVSDYEELSDLIKLYEREHHFVEPGDPIEIIKLKMRYMGLTRQDLIPLIGSKGVVSDIFRKKRGLSKAMIREFSKLLNIDQSILNIADTGLATVVEEKKAIVSTETRSVFSFPKAMLIQINNFQGSVRSRGCLFAMCA